jgi:hypothetical protein
MDKRSRRRLSRQISGQALARIPGPALVPFLLFWCLGSFALGQELAQLPLAALAAAAIHPLQSALQAQGALAHAAPNPSITHTHQVATGLLGGKPPAAPAHKTSAKAGHAKTKLTAHDRWVGYYTLDGSAALRNEMAGAGAYADHGQLFVALTDNTSWYWGSQIAWGEQRGWTVALGWNPRFASGAVSLWMGHPDAWADGPYSCM